MESMSQAPYLAAGVRDGLRLGHGKLIDSMIHDGLWDPYNDLHMGSCAELCAAEYKLSREEQDAYSPRELPPRPRGDREGALRRRRSSPVRGRRRRRARRRSVDRDEEPFKVDLDRMATLRPAFQKDGTVTAGNASKINDGAAALVLTTAAHAATLGQEAAGPHRRPRLASRRSPSGSPPRRSAPCARVLGARRPGSRRHRSLGGQRGLRRRRAGLHPRARPRSRRASTCAAARSPSAIPSAPRARASWSPCSTPWRERGARRGCAAHLHRRRRGDGDDRRAAGLAARSCRRAAADQPSLAARLALSSASGTARRSAGAADARRGSRRQHGEPPAPRRPLAPRRPAQPARSPAEPGASGRRRPARAADRRRPAPAAAPAATPARRPRPPSSPTASTSTSTSPRRRAAAAPPAAPATLDYKREDYAVLTGDVQVQYQDMDLYRRPRRDRPHHQGGHRRGQRHRRPGAAADDRRRPLDFDLDTKTGTLENATAQVAPDYYFSGSEIEKTGADTYEVTDGVFTSCTQETPDWSFRLARADVEVEGYAHIHHATMRVKTLPVFYTPYILWPAKTERTSGLLIPNIGYSEARGASSGLAYYQMLGRSYDTTFHFDALQPRATSGSATSSATGPTEGTWGDLAGYCRQGPGAQGKERWKIDLNHDTERPAVRHARLVSVPELLGLQLPPRLRARLRHQHPALHRQPRLRHRQLGPQPAQLPGRRPPDAVHIGTDFDFNVDQRKLPEIEYQLRSTEHRPDALLSPGATARSTTSTSPARHGLRQLRPLRPLPAAHPAGPHLPLAQRSRSPAASASPGTATASDHLRRRRRAEPATPRRR